MGRVAIVLCSTILLAGCAGSGEEDAAASTEMSASTSSELVVEGAEASASGVAQPDLQDEGYVVINEFPHDDQAFTQGLLFHGRTFYESTGLEGASSIRKVDLASGEVLKKADLDAQYFGEGITTIGDRLWQLTWQDQIGFLYNRKTFKRIGKFNYKGEGWGLTDNNNKQIIMSNGTDVITFRSPDTFKVKRRINVTENGEPVLYLNELEWIKGEIWANVWQQMHIVRIDPSTGEVTDRIDFTALVQKEESESGGEVDVLNGIAYLASEDRIFVTGKWWRHIYEIELVEP